LDEEILDFPSHPYGQVVGRMRGSLNLNCHDGWILEFEFVGGGNEIFGSHLNFKLRAKIING